MLHSSNQSFIVLLSVEFLPLVRFLLVINAPEKVQYLYRTELSANSKKTEVNKTGEPKSTSIARFTPKKHY